MDAADDGYYIAGWPMVHSLDIPAAAQEQYVKDVVSLIMQVPSKVFKALTATPPLNVIVRSAHTRSAVHAC